MQEPIPRKVSRRYRGRNLKIPILKRISKRLRGTHGGAFASNSVKLMASHTMMWGLGAPR